jgi:hypothetical protein
LVGPILTGGLASMETPEQFGPRNAGQEVAAWVAKTAAVVIKRNKGGAFIGLR